MEQVFAGAWIALQAVAMYLLADFVNGFFHWAEDTLGADDTPVWGRLFAARNSIHHDDPSDIVRVHWLRSNAILLIFCLFLVVVFSAFGALSWQVMVFILCGGFSQQAHRFAHAPPARLPRVARWLQKARVIQDGRHHWVHHRPPHLTRYCVMSPWLNPVLDGLRFWRLMDRLLVPVFGAPRRPDLKSRPWYRETAFWVRSEAVGSG